MSDKPLRKHAAGWGYVLVTWSNFFWHRINSLWVSVSPGNCGVRQTLKYSEWALQHGRARPPPEGGYLRTRCIPRLGRTRGDIRQGWVFVSIDRFYRLLNNSNIASRFLGSSASQLR